MSVFVSGPRRLYLLLLFYQPLAAHAVTGPGTAGAVDGPLGVGPGVAPAARHAGGRLVVAFRLQRLWRGRVVGLTFHVVDLFPPGHPVGSGTKEEQGPSASNH